MKKEIDILFLNMSRTKLDENKFYELILREFRNSFIGRGFSDSDSDDLSSIAVEKSIKLIARYNNKGNFSGFFYSRFNFIVGDSIRFFLGRKKKTKIIEMFSDECLYDSPIEDFSLLIIDKDYFRPISIAISELKPRYQQVIELIYFRKFRISQIAEAWGVTRQAIFTLHQRAIKEIAKKTSDKFTDYNN
jgi:RNA polymerase sigma factor (sigma-70 family)